MGTHTVQEVCDGHFVGLIEVTVGQLLGSMDVVEVIVGRVLNVQP